MAETTNFADMISKIAHELRSPLTSVKGFSATLIGRWDRFTDEQRFELVEAIHSDAERMGRIVSEVLDLARLESDRLELHRTQVELGEIAAKAAEHVSRLPGSDRVEIDVPAGLVAHVDGDRIEHVLTNLIENAVKFSEEGAITVRGKAIDGIVEVSVTDSGVGIEPDRLSAIFSGPGPTGQKATPLGTGLGLYLSRKLVQAHGGTLEVASTQGEGSTFTMQVPAGTA
jgi:signal transduction histidine kinase